MIQGSQEWHDYRASRFNASEAGAVMGVNPWQPRNPAELFDLKTGAFEVAENAAMRRGTAMEPEARVAVQEATGEQFTPCVREKGRYSASLDGLNFDEDLALEIKCPMRKDSKLFGINRAAELKAAAPHYWWQLVHQQYVAGFESVLFAVYHPDVGVHRVSITADELIADRDALIEAWEAFGKAWDAGERPDDGKQERNDEEWLAAVSEYASAKEAAAEAAKAEKDAKQRLIDLAGGKTTTGGGITVAKVERKGSVDYAKIPELEGVDLEFYRKKSTSYWSVK